MTNKQDTKNKKVDIKELIDHLSKKDYSSFIRDINYSETFVKQHLLYSSWDSSIQKSKRDYGRFRGVGTTHPFFSSQSYVNSHIEQSYTDHADELSGDSVLSPMEIFSALALDEGILNKVRDSDMANELYQFYSQHAGDVFDKKDVTITSPEFLWATLERRRDEDSKYICALNAIPLALHYDIDYYLSHGNRPHYNPHLHFFRNKNLVSILNTILLCNKEFYEALMHSALLYTYRRVLDPDHKIVEKAFDIGLLHYCCLLQRLSRSYKNYITSQLQDIKKSIPYLGLNIDSTTVNKAMYTSAYTDYTYTWDEYTNGHDSYTNGPDHQLSKLTENLTEDTINKVTQKIFDTTNSIADVMSYSLLKQADNIHISTFNNSSKIDNVLDQNYEIHRMIESFFGSENDILKKVKNSYIRYTMEAIDNKIHKFNSIIRTTTLACVTVEVKKQLKAHDIYKLISDCSRKRRKDIPSNPYEDNSYGYDEWNDWHARWCAPPITQPNTNPPYHNDIWWGIDNNNNKPMC